MVVFWHIPKTGGTSVLHACRARIGDQAVYVKKLGRAVPSCRFFQTGSVRNEALLPAGAREVTILRDPVERVLSLYDYLRSDPRRALHRATLAGPETFVRLGNPELDNWQVRHLSGKGLDPSPVGEGDLGRAIAVATQMALVGCTDGLPAFLAKLGAMLGCELEVLHKRKAKEGAPHRSDPVLRAYIRDRHEFDMRLYEAMK